jgi:hypothetical protein
LQWWNTLFSWQDNIALEKFNHLAIVLKSTAQALEVIVVSHRRVATLCSFLGFSLYGLLVSSVAILFNPTL